jgi:hypothetical protein
MRRQGRHHREKPKDFTRSEIKTMGPKGHNHSGLVVCGHHYEKITAIVRCEDKPAGKRGCERLYGVSIGIRGCRKFAQVRRRCECRICVYGERVGSGDRDPLVMSRGVYVVWRSQEMRGGVHSKAYSTAAEHASLAVASLPCCRKLCSVSNDASHAGHEWSPREQTLDGPCERERFDDCEA